MYLIPADHDVHPEMYFLSIHGRPLFAQQDTIFHLINIQISLLHLQEKETTMKYNYSFRCLLFI